MLSRPASSLCSQTSPFSKQKILLQTLFSLCCFPAPKPCFFPQLPILSDLNSRAWQVKATSQLVFSQLFKFSIHYSSLVLCTPGSTVNVLPLTWIPDQFLGSHSPGVALRPTSKVTFSFKEKKIFFQPSPRLFTILSFNKFMQQISSQFSIYHGCWWVVLKLFFALSIYTILKLYDKFIFKIPLNVKNADSQLFKRTRGCITDSANQATSGICKVHCETGWGWNLRGDPILLCRH